MDIGHVLSDMPTSSLYGASMNFSDAMYMCFAFSIVFCNALCFNIYPWVLETNYTCLQIVHVRMTVRRALDNAKILYYCI